MINHFVTLALAEKVAALTTENYLAARSQRGDVAKIRSALAKVADDRRTSGMKYSLVLLANQSSASQT